MRQKTRRWCVGEHERKMLKVGEKVTHRCGSHGDDSGRQLAVARLDVRVHALLRTVPARDEDAPLLSLSVHELTSVVCDPVHRDVAFFRVGSTSPKGKNTLLSRKRHHRHCFDGRSPADRNGKRFETRRVGLGQGQGESAHGIGSPPAPGAVGRLVGTCAAMAAASECVRMCRSDLVAGRPTQSGESSPGVTATH